MTWNSMKRKFDRANRSWSRPIRRRVGRSTKVLSKIAARAGRIARGMPKWGPLAAIAQMGMDTPWNRSYKKFKERQWAQKRAVKGGGPVPSAPSSRVPAKYAVAPRMTKFRKATVTKQKVPKSAIVHYKEFGQFNAEKCMYINHEHWGNIEKMWTGIGYGLTKLLLPYGKIYNAKSLEDPCIGPRTSVITPETMYDNKTAGAAPTTKLRLVFVTEGADGATTRDSADIVLEDIGANPDRYRSFDDIAVDVTSALRTHYTYTAKTWLAEAQIYVGDYDANNLMNAQPIYIQNLDDAEINLYVNSLVKFQNVTPSDGASADKHSIDANPLVGRVFTAKGHYPQIDSDLLNAGDRTLDTFFGDVDDSTNGITLLGHGNAHTANDLGRISHIPNARELYGNQHVKAGQIYLAAGAMKFHKTTFTLKKTFRSLAGISLGGLDAVGDPGRRLGMHTMFGFTLQHKHGEDTIQVGYNRDTDVGCYVKHKRVVHPLKTNYTTDSGVITTTVIPTEHAGPSN